MKYSIGVDIGGTSIKTGVVEETGTIILQSETPTGEDRAESITNVIISQIEKIRSESGQTGTPVGVGVPGIVTPGGDILSFANIHSLENHPLGKILSDRFGTDIFIDNDANCAAAGELLFGAAKGARHCILVTLGTGIGAGIIIDGKIYQGVRGGAGEAGHMIISPGGRICGCGNRGCWEAYGSASAMVRYAAELLKNEGRSSMLGVPAESLNAKIIEQAAKEGDSIAEKAFNETAEYIGIGVANLLNIFDPDIILIGGGLSQSGEFLLGKVRTAAYSLANSTARKAPIEKAALGNSAGIIGASSLPFLPRRSGHI
jgi:glucokinase